MTIDRTPKPCLHPQADHRHGEYATYVLDRCRCLPCAFAGSIYGEGWRETQSRGESRMCSPAEARAHIKELRASGWTYKGIARESGVGLSTIERMARGYHRQKTVRKSLAERVLAVHPKFFTDRSIVPAHGARRRLHALAALGWTARAIAARSGISYNAVVSISSGASKGCQVGTYNSVVKIYDVLWDKAPEPRDQHDAGIVARTRKYAARNGWAPPMAWDDETIDDPAAQPNYGQVPDESNTRMDLYQQGLSDGQIGAAVGVSTDAIQKWRTRRNLPSNYYTREGRAS